MVRIQILSPTAAAYRPCLLPNALRISALHHGNAHTFLRAGRRPTIPRAQCCGSFVPRRVMLPAAVDRVRHRCRMNNKSDIVPQLEIGRPEEKGKPTKPVNGIFWILLLNLAIFVADHLFQVQQIKTLYLYHSWPTWYQFVTATFCHADWNHLSSNLFFLYIFGKLVEEEEGSFGLWVSYIVTGVGANLVSWFVLPRSAVSMGASGAVFGLFAISVLVRLSWNWRKILEVLILGQFVIDKVMEAAQASIRLPGTFGREVHSVNHIAHFSGALIGVALILLITGVPSNSPEKDVKALKGKNKKMS